MPSSRVSTLELFFDLVFVFTVTQVALIVEHHPSWSSAAQAMLELTVIYWMYGGFAWLTNLLGTSTARQQLFVLTGMAALLVVSLAIPRAFEDDGVVFGIAYLALILIHLGGFLLRGSATFRSMLQVGATNVAGAVVVLVAGFTHGSAHWPLWILAVLVLYLPALASHNTSNFAIGADHFAERHGLVILIALGESLVSVAVGAQDETLHASLVIGALCGLAASAALWWAYFGGDDEAAASAYAGLPDQRRGQLALWGYDLPHLCMLAGILAVAAGSRLSLEDLTAPTTLAAAAFIGGGAAVFLLALAGFRAALGYAVPWPRAVAGLVLLATVPVGTELGAAQQLAVVAVLVTVVVAAERVGPLPAADPIRQDERA